MKIKGTLKVGDYLYRVDPQRLSVKVFRISKPDEKQEAATTNEIFSWEMGELRKFQLPIIDKFPFEFKGLLYFLTEDEANHYIKTQIGM